VSADDPNDPNVTMPSGLPALTGKIISPGSQKYRMVAKADDEGYQVVAQSNQTGMVYRGTTDAEGVFEIDIPEEEAGNTFMISILGSDGQPVGPVLFGTSGEQGLAGLQVSQEVSLGAIALPDDPTAEAIVPGEDADEGIDALADPNLAVRLNEEGLPVGIASHGKGADALVDSGTEGPAGDRLVDGDEDGLIDMFDADDDGDGLVDDFEVGSTEPGTGVWDHRVNFFMNLKINADRAILYYDGTAEQIAEALKVDTLITLEAVMEPQATRSIASMRALETPGRDYMTLAEKFQDSVDRDNYVNWASVGYYAFDPRSDRFDAFIRPNDVMDAGDTFTVEISFDDGTTEQYSRMINYVFKNIPKLLQYGAGTALTDFDVHDPNINGTDHHPIPLDGEQDLVLVFNPPVDENGDWITGMYYTFTIFYHAADEGTYTVTIPKEAFPDTVVLQSGGTAEVGSYKIDITADCPSGNAAIMLVFAKPQTQ